MSLLLKAKQQYTSLAEGDIMLKGGKFLKKL